MAGERIPDGWKRVAEFDDRPSGEKNKGGPRGDYQRLLRACANGSVRAFKQDGEWVINEKDAAKVVSTAPVNSPRKSELDGEAICFSIDSMRVSVVSQLVTLTNAVRDLRGTVELLLQQAEEANSRNRSDFENYMGSAGAGNAAPEEA